MPNTRDFIASHLNDDVQRLALSKAPDGVDMPLALRQIDGRQRAKNKLPRLAANPDILFPQHLSVEQCSSEETANYKREILGRVMHDAGIDAKGLSFADLTGGFGIDFISLSPLFGKALYVERNKELCDIAANNFKTLGLNNTEILNGDAEQVVSEGLAADVIFIDPARRDNTGKRTYAISDCTPDVISLIPKLLARTAVPAPLLFLKLSPMLDWHKAVNDIQEQGMAVIEVHIVSVKNDCKELLILSVPNNSNGNYSAAPRLFCKNDDSLLECPYNSLEHVEERAAGIANFLHIPNASVMKAGCWGFVSQKFGAFQASQNSHIFFSTEEIPDFPGKSFRILHSFTLNKKDLRTALSGITHANISVRNFPMTADALRKRLKLKDGGNHHIFATTIKSEHKLFLCIPH